MHTPRLLDVSGITEADLDGQHLKDLLLRLSCEHLKAICCELAIGVTAPNKDAYVERILTKADLGKVLEVVPRYEYHGGYNYLYLYRCKEHPLLECTAREQFQERLVEYGVQDYLDSREHIKGRETGLVFSTIDEEKHKLYFQFVEYKAVMRISRETTAEGRLELVPAKLRYPIIIVINQDRRLLQVRLNGYTYNPVRDPVNTSDYARDVIHYLEEFCATTTVAIEPLDWRATIRSLSSREDDALVFSQKDLMPAVGGYLRLKDKDQGLTPFLRRLEQRIKQRMEEHSPGSAQGFDLVQIINDIEMDSNVPCVHLISPDGNIAVKIDLEAGREHVYFGASPEEEEVDYVVDAMLGHL